MKETALTAAINTAIQQATGLCEQKQFEAAVQRLKQEIDRIEKLNLY